MFNSVKKVNISAANIRTNFELSKYFCGNLPFIFFLVRKMSFFERTNAEFPAGIAPTGNYFIALSMSW